MTTTTVSGGFIGRSTELGRLLAAMERAGRGQPAMVLLAGDAGVGKTRLLVELADRARERGVQVLIGGCLELGDVGLPYVPIVAALHGFAAEAGNDEVLVGAAKGLARLGSLLSELADQPTTPASMDKASRAALVAPEEGGADAQTAAVSVEAAATSVTVIAWLVPSQSPRPAIGTTGA